MTRFQNRSKIAENVDLDCNIIKLSKRILWKKNRGSELEGDDEHAEHV